MLRRIFGLKWEEETWKWRRLHNEDVYDVYSSPNNRVNEKKRMSWAGHVARMKYRRYAYRVFVRRPEEKSLLGRTSRRCEDNIQTVLKEIEWEGVDCLTGTGGGLF